MKDSPQETDKSASDALFEQGVEDLIRHVDRMVRESGDPRGFDAAKWVHNWINQQVPALGFKAPASYLRTREGQELISTMLEANRAGAYV